MKVITVETTRAGILIPPDEVLPLQGMYPPDLCEMVSKKYSFVYPPDFTQSQGTFRDKGLEFKMGKFQIDGEDHFIEGFTVYSDGFIAQASSTSIAESFIKDIMLWGIESLGFRITQEELKKIAYLSTLVVEFNDTIDGLIKHFEILSKKLTNTLTSTYDADLSVHCSSLSLNYDRSLLTGRLTQLSAFIIERRIDQPYESNRFLCQAPLRTEDHIQLLQDFESLF